MRVTPRLNIQSLLAALVLLGASILAIAATVSFADAAVVNRIEVQGNQRVDAGTIEAYLSIQPGRNFSSEDEDASLKALFTHFSPTSTWICAARHWSSWWSRIR